MPAVSVPQKDGEIVVYDGDKSHVYQVKDGEIAVTADHLAAVLHAVQGSELKPKPGKE